VLIGHLRVATMSRGLRQRPQPGDTYWDGPAVLQPCQHGKLVRGTKDKEHAMAQNLNIAIAVDERIQGLSSEIETLARQDQGCKRLMSVPGIAPIIASAMVAAIGTGGAFSKGRDFGAWLGLVPKQSRRETAPPLAAYQSAAIVIGAPCSFKLPGSCWSEWGKSIGTAMGSNPGSKQPKSVCTTTCWRSRWPTSSPVSPGRFSTKDAPLLRPQVGTKERPPGTNKGTAPSKEDY
jgi:hypothetical protein